MIDQNTLQLIVSLVIALFGGAGALTLEKLYARWQKSREDAADIRIHQIADRAELTQQLFEQQDKLIKRIDEVEKELTTWRKRYWSKVARNKDLIAQVNALKARLDQVEAELDEWKAKYQDEVARNERLVSEKERLEAKVSDMDVEIQRLRRRIRVLEDREGIVNGE